MRDYTFNLFFDNDPIGQGYGSGNSALEAFEYAYEKETVRLPVSVPIDVHAITPTGLVVVFSVKRLG